MCLSNVLSTNQSGTFTFDSGGGDVNRLQKMLRVKSLPVRFKLMFSPSSIPDENEAEMVEKAAATAAADDDGDDGNDEDGSSCGGDDDDEGVITEIRFVPSDKGVCELPH